MPTYLDFDTTKKFRDILLNKNLKVQNGPQTFTANSYDVSTLNVYENRNLGDVDDNRSNNLLIHQNTNIYKPLQYVIEENLNVLARRANLDYYPYFQTNQDHTLIGILTTDKFDNESELFKFSANNIKNERNGPIQARIAQNLYTSTLGKVRLLDALDGNLSTLSNIVTGKEPLIELNNKITVSNNIFGQTLDLILTIGGVQLPWTEIPGDYLTNPKNPLNNNSSIIDSIGNLLGFKNTKSVIKPSELFIEYMGSGQKTRLFENLSYSKYSPNYNTFTSIFNSSISLGKPYIGDDDTNDVKRAMTDGNDRIVRGNFYLSLLFDKTQAELFQTDRNIGEGGSVAGKLTWFTKKSKNRIVNSNIENTFSTNYQFKTGSILETTQQILDSLPSDTTRYSHVANAIDQTSKVFVDGEIAMSKGSGVRNVSGSTLFNGGNEYCRVWTKDKAYMKYSDTMKRTGLIRKFNSSVMSTPWNLNIAPMSNGKQTFDGSTNIEKYGNGFRAKKYMFSIENLAWKTSNKPEFTYNDLPYCERGPNGGRIMWFPPYGIKISEQNGTSWEENTFIGRPEPIFTYQKTNRTANLSFKIIVDHPSILNLLTKNQFKNMSETESDNYINAFFAGCEELDFYDLIKKYSSLDKTDVEMIKTYLNSGKDTETIKRYKSRIVPETDPVPASNTSNNIEKTHILYFNNDVPGNNPNLTSELTYSQTFDTYKGTGKRLYLSDLNKGLNIITGKPWNNTGYTHDYKILTASGVTSKPDVPTLTKMVERTNNSIEKLFTEATKNYNEYSVNVNTLKDTIIKNKVKSVRLMFVSSASAVADDNYNLKLSYRRSHSLISDFFTKLSIDGDITNAINKVVWELPKNEQLKKGTSVVEFESNPIKIPFTDLGFKVDGDIEIKIVLNAGEAYKNEKPTDGLIGEENKIVDCTDATLPITSPELKKTIPASFRCRQTTIFITYDVVDKIDAKNGTNKIVVDELVEQKTQKPNIDILKKIVMKVLGECYYFKKLEEDSPIQFSSLTEQLKYFHPAFHSMTPEGLNSRLTFLNQCMRPGDTIPIKGITDVNDLNSRNTTFGPPPIIVFRFGDFYNTKAIIRDYNIEYDESIWDLNPEGIGVQPMLATVTLQLTLIGGQGMEGPVNELQNALSSNFYANTEVYDYRSTATEDRTKFNKEILEEILEYKKSETEQVYSDLPNSNKIINGQYIGQIDNTGYKIDYTTLVLRLYDVLPSYIDNYQSYYNLINNRYGNKISTLMLSSIYRDVSNYVVKTDGSDITIELFGNYPTTKDKTYYVDNFKKVMKNSIETYDLTRLLKMNINENLINKSNEVLRNYLLVNLDIIIDDFLVSKSQNLEKNRNDLIKILDSLNYIISTTCDGQINGDTNNKFELAGFDKIKFYEAYSPVFEFLNKSNEKFELSFDNTYDFNNQNMSDTVLLEFISIFLIKDDVDKIITDYIKQGGVFKNSIENIRTCFNNFIKTPVTVNVNIDNFPIHTKDLSIIYNGADTGQISVEDLEILNKVLSTGKINGYDYNKNLNYFR